MRKRGEGSPAGGQFHDLGGDVRVAVAVTADPGSRPHDRPVQEIGIRPAATQRVANRGVDLGDDLEERRRVVPQAGFDLVGDLQPGQPDQRRLPERENLAAQFPFDLPAVLGLVLAVQAQPHQPGDVVLRVEDGTPPGLGRMRGDHRGHQRATQCGGDGIGPQVGRVEFAVGSCQGAVRRRLPRSDVYRAATFAVDILGDVGQ